MYAKLFKSLWDGTMADDWHLWSLWAFMLAHKDSAGVVDMTHEAIARRSGIPLDIVKAGIAKLEAPDPRSRSKELDGRRIIRLDEHRDWGWEIVNAATYSEMRDPETRRQQNRDASSRRRARLAAEAASADPSAIVSTRQRSSAHVDTDTEIEAPSLRSGASPTPSVGTVENGPAGDAPDHPAASTDGPSCPEPAPVLVLDAPPGRKGYGTARTRFGPGALDPTWCEMADRNGLALPTNRGGDWYAGERLLAEWVRAYPAVKVPDELRRMRAWLVSNPAKVKTPQGMARAVNAWMGREQDGGGRAGGGMPRRGQRAAGDSDYLAQNGARIGAGGAR